MATKAKKRKRKRKPPKLCPIHGVKLVYTPNRWGAHWNCPTDGCSVRCWGGATSTPGDAETFELRKRAHAAFDPLWKGSMLKFQRRPEAYRWMQEVMKLGPRECHIGLFNAQQCRELLRHIDELKQRPATGPPERTVSAKPVAGAGQ